MLGLPVILLNKSGTNQKSSFWFKISISQIGAWYYYIQYSIVCNILIVTKNGICIWRKCQKAHRGERQDSLYAMCSLVFQSHDRQAVMWSQEATSRSLVKACLAAVVQHNHRPIGTNVTSLRLVKNTRDISLRWPSDYSKTDPCYKSVGREASVAQQAKWCQLLWGGDFREYSTGACCLAALSSHISRCRAVSFIRWSLTKGCRHLGQLRALPGAGYRMWLRRDFKCLEKL